MSKDNLISINDLLNIEENCNVFIFDRENRLSDFNACQFELLKKTLKINSRDEVLGKHVSELHDAAACEIVIKENQLVIETGKAHIFYNFVKFAHYKSMAFSTLKLPIYNSKKQITGVFGVSFHLASYASQEDKSQQLSKREYECLTYLIRAKSAAAIATRLKISKRTVETHIDNIKNKLGCRDKNELLSKVFDIGLTALLPDSDAISEPFTSGSFTQHVQNSFKKS